MRTIKFLLRGWIKSSRLANRIDGFTLIELLVALMMAVLIITPLLGFAIDVMNTDQKEQAKATSEQEIQAAIDYITRDLQQAVYIYDATGIQNTSSNTSSPGISDSLPTVNGGIPILVFWKRELVTGVVANQSTTKDDTFVYSLVAYYLIKDNNTTWSKAARIARWQIKDGVQTSSTDTNGVTCTGYTGKYINTNNCPDPGFAVFSLNGTGNLDQKMNKWKKTTASYTNFAQVLVDYIDQTQKTSTNTNPNLPSSLCPTGTSTVSDPSTNSPMTSFYACVDNINTTAQIVIRGNALARIQKSNIDYANSSQKTYFPTVGITVQGRGYLYTQ